MFTLDYLSCLEYRPVLILPITKPLARDFVDVLILAEGNHHQKEKNENIGVEHVMFGGIRNAFQQTKELLPVTLVYGRCTSQPACSRCWSLRKIHGVLHRRRPYTAAVGNVDYRHNVASVTVLDIHEDKTLTRRTRFTPNLFELPPALNTLRGWRISAK